jgi:hypothetical protein
MDQYPDGSPHGGAGSPGGTSVIGPVDLNADLDFEPDLEPDVDLLDQLMGDDPDTAARLEELAAQLSDSVEAARSEGETSPTNPAVNTPTAQPVVQAGQPSPTNPTEHSTRPTGGPSRPATV